MYNIPMDPESPIETDRPTASGKPGAGSPLEFWEPEEQADPVALERREPRKPGSVVRTDMDDESMPDNYFVLLSRGGAKRGTLTRSGPEPEERGAAHDEVEEPDYYEILQIRPQAEPETIHRVYRMMAARFHPDNPETGDLDKFLLLKSAYEVLSDPDRRATYDARRQKHDNGPMAIFEMKDFVTGVEAESNRRLGVLSLLYNQRRMDPEHPGISVLNLERRMAIPREYLVFTLWYLRSKNYATVADNSDYALTADGADFVEGNVDKSEILGKLLFPGGY